MNKEICYSDDGLWKVKPEYIIKGKNNIACFPYKKCLSFWSFYSLQNCTPKLTYARNTHEKKSQTREYPQEKFQTHEISTINNFGPAKAQWHDSTKPTRSTIAHDTGNLAHSELHTA